jgi:hypothetical protein
VGNDGEVVAGVSAGSSGMESSGMQSTMADNLHGELSDDTGASRAELGARQLGTMTKQGTEQGMAAVGPACRARRRRRNHPERETRADGVGHMSQGERAPRVANGGR